MKYLLKRLTWGLIPWAIPFVVSFFVWDVEANAPAIPQEWFAGLMGLMWAIGLVIAANLWFKSIKKKDAKSDGLKTGIIWYVQALLLDAIFLVALFNMALTNYWPMFLAYAGNIVIMAGIGHLVSQK